jgi:hypothetical protein
VFNFKYYLEMKTALQLDVTFDQILSLVRQLPRKQKIKLTRELEKDVVGTQLTQLLKAFKSTNLDVDTINSEVESVRQEIYDQRKS